MEDWKRNGSGYYDPTATKAMESLHDEKEAKKRLTELMYDIFETCDEYGFHLENRLILRDKFTGKVFR